MPSLAHVFLRPPPVFVLDTRIPESVKTLVKRGPVNRPPWMDGIHWGRGHIEFKRRRVISKLLPAESGVSPDHRVSGLKSARVVKAIISHPPHLA